MNGYNFTERVRKILAMTREEAVRLGHPYIGTEHMLLGLLAEGGVANMMLSALDVDPDAVRSAILSIVKPGPGPTGPDLPYTSRAKKVLELALDEARDLNHNYVGDEHLLLGLLREMKGIAAQVLCEAGLTLENARAEALRILSVESPPPPLYALAEYFPKSARRLREIISAGHDVAVGRQSPFIASTHVAIALLQHPGGMANAALERLNFDRAAVLSALNQVALRGTKPVDPDGVVTPTPELLTAMDAMERLRRESNAATAGSHHLLLALIMTSPDVHSAFTEQSVFANMIRESVRWLSG
jgi:ATP-dependent Clp protease ATP-binding subunit ClpA